MFRSSFRRPSACLIAIFAGAATSAAMAEDPGAKPVLAVCADPSNLPYSNSREEGFENRIARLLADDMQAELRYTWSMQRRSFFRRTLLAGACDVVISVPTTLAIVAGTRPYFTSSYVFVTRVAETAHPTSLDDAYLRDTRIGLQLIGAEGINTPPAMALARRGISQHITGFPMWADDEEANPQGRIIDAVAQSTIDVALVWGPFAGCFAKPYGAALRIDPINAGEDTPDLTFTFPMAIGVRKADTALRDRLQDALDRHHAEIDSILRSYGVPLVTTQSPSEAPAANTAALVAPTL
jgi:mxaJ protein